MNPEMRRRLGACYKRMASLGFDPLKTLDAIRGLRPYLRDLKTLKAQQKVIGGTFPLGSANPCFSDRYASSGSASGAYFHQDLLVAGRVFANNPVIHVDIGSRVDGFVAHVASFRRIEVLDIRPLKSTVPNIRFLQADLMAPLERPFIEYCDSLSCLHALEHFGLGRYGDPVRYDGHLLGLDNMHRMLRPGGTFYLSVPIGPQRIEFNAHRVFSVGHLLELLEPRFKIERFSFVDDHGDLHDQVDFRSDAAARSFDCIHGCGIFETRKQ